MTGLAEALALLEGTALTVAAVFLRIGAAFALVPVFGEQVIPARVRLALALAMTLVVAPAVAPQLAPRLGAAPGLPLFLALLASETVIGLMLGAALRLMVMALQIAGSIIAQAASLSQLVGGAGQEPLPAMGHVLFLGGLALATLSGLHLRLAHYFIGTYALLPAAEWPAGRLMSGWGVALVAQVFALAFSLALPFVAVSLFYNLTLGVINRAMPQLMVAFVGAPAISLAGLALLALLAPVLVQLWRAAFHALLANPAGPLG